MSCFLVFFSDQIVKENEGGNPCHEGRAETAPMGSFTCNPNVSLCIEKWEGPNSGITSFDNIGLAMLTVFQVRYNKLISQNSFIARNFIFLNIFTRPLYLTVFILFQCVTMEGWTPILYWVRVI